MFKISFTSLAFFLTSCMITLVFSQFYDMEGPRRRENPSPHISRSTNQFCDLFYSNIAAKADANVACSPLSAHIVLSLVASGARGKTAEELNRGLHLPAEDSLAYNEFESLLASLNDVAEVELNLANTLFIQENVSLIPDFLSTSSKFFHSDTQRVDFRNSAASVRQINSWVKNQTKNKIKEIISAENIDDATRIILVNAIYFKGAWAHQFKHEYTENRPFYITKDAKTHVPTMFNKFEYAHGRVKGLNARIIELPYSNKDFSMLILLPNDIDGLQFLEMNFNRERMENVNWQLEKVELYLPKFKVESTLLLEETLEEMGMATMFSDFADFSGMALVPLKVDKIIQKAFVEVNEEGCEAAVVSAVKSRQQRMAVMPETFQVDRPFMFIIQHKPSNIPIFVGSIRNLQMMYKKDEL